MLPPSRVFLRVKYFKILDFTLKRKDTTRIEKTKKILKVYCFFQRVLRRFESVVILCAANLHASAKRLIITLRVTMVLFESARIWYFFFTGFCIYIQFAFSYFFNYMRFLPMLLKSSFIILFLFVLIL